MESPKVSIVTTTYNDRENLEKIIRQVRSQDYENLEYIIVDGGSADGTLEVIREAQKDFGQRLKWISQPDKGIYDALNKGLKMSSGEILGCCFDEFAGPDVVAKMVDIMEREGTDGVHGDLDYVDGDRVVRRWRQGQGKLVFGWMPGHPTLYLRRSVYENFGYYRTDYRISADYEFMIRILKDGKVRLSYLPEVLIRMSHGGTSTNSLRAYLAGMKEGHRALKENGIPMAAFTDFCRTLRVLAQFVKKG
ncbi:MAG: glycosyltransferase [Lachnospiraceae bacterium]|nr:glycosyltransferase [Lachnospiraceae bacterium]